MKYEFDGVNVGLKIRQARQAKGWSQEVLAEKANCTPQYISKFEKGGLSDMNWITLLSNILDCNLLEASIDVEGSIGELGREILIVLVENKGCIFTSNLVSEYMHGLSDAQVTHEIVKLSKIGMVVREIYNNWNNAEEDRLFITAKGLISLKNSDLNTSASELVFDNLDSVETYEQILGELNSYQEYIDSREAEKIIRNIYGNLLNDEYLLSFPVYRVNYIKYLINLIENERDTDLVKNIFLDKEACTCSSCYHDILYRMVMGLDNKELSAYLAYNDFNEYDDWDFMKYFINIYDNEDEVKQNAISQFVDEFNIQSKNTESPYSLDHIIDVYNATLKKLQDELGTDLPLLGIRDEYNVSLALTNKQIEMLEDLLEMSDSIESAFRMINCLIPKEVYESRKPEDAVSPYPCDWFSKEEIADFIEENFGSAKTDSEREIDAKLNQIYMLMPEVAKYYKFPKEWEDNGLAELVRSKIGINIEA